MDEVEAAAALLRERDHRPVGLEIGDVARDGVAARLGRDRLGAVGVEVGAHDRRALRREGERGRAPEPAGRARDERDPAGEAAHRVSASARSASPAIASPNVVRYGSSTEPASARR